MFNPRRIVSAIFFGGLLAGALVAPASAHSVLVSSDPATNASLTTLPQALTLTFNENISSKYIAVTVIGPDNQIDDDKPTAVDNVVTEGLKQDAKAGKYTVSYRVISADGHPVSGSFAFDYSGSATTTVAPTTSSTTAPVNAAATSTAGHRANNLLVPITVGIVLLIGVVFEGVRRVRLR